MWRSSSSLLTLLLLVSATQALWPANWLLINDSGVNKGLLGVGGGGGGPPRQEEDEVEAVQEEMYEFIKPKKHHNKLDAVKM